MAGAAPGGLSASPALPPAAFAEVRRRAIFDCCKWDAQVEDVGVLAPYVVVVEAATWARLAGWAEALAAETLAAEREIAARPQLLRRLGLGLRLRAQLARGVAPGPRAMRFDFHPTTEGWRISEANTDVPGGYIEASGFTALMAAHHPGLVPVGDPARALVAAARRAGPAVGFVHATAYTDDRQVMVYLGRRLEAEGGTPHLVSPADLSWHEGCARLADGTPLDALVRFFPAEWLPNLPRRSGWRHFFAGARTPLSNPGSALITQSKRFPLTWDALATPLPTWRALLPETREPRDAHGDADGWVYKPALGRIGEGILLPGVETSDAAEIVHALRRRPDDWIAQRRFEIVPLAGAGYPCLGVYTVDGVAAGAYGRVGVTPLIDARAADVAVLRPAGP